MEEVSHGVYKDALTFAPLQWSRKAGLVKIDATRPNIAITAFSSGAFVLTMTHRLQPSSHAHGITIRAAGRDHQAT